ncbi:hypothetical protein JKP88DRAFT_206182 [Tribonema minus]|uniref:Fe2OG dioxygenase domain-containing protein n=1 Tax=Tribonema minus TaxID=303371 RepID=A0A836CK11_9STRA|nr:hypothetical protein JKP88DRAFT_206182 [Tribonema minus]
MVCGAAAGETATTDTFEALQRNAPPWWDVVITSDAAAAKQQVEEAWTLLQAWLQHEHAVDLSRFSPPLNTITFAKIAGGLERCLVPLQLESPLVAYAQSLLTADSTVKIAALRALAPVLPPELHLPSDAQGPVLMQASERRVALLAQVAADPAQSPFPPLSALALLPRSAPRAPHACCPNAQLEGCWDARSGQLRAQLVALRSIVAGDALTVPRVSVAQPSWRQRRADLRASLGDAAYECACARCAVESRTVDASALPPHDTLALANQALEEGRCAAALELYRAAAESAAAAPAAQKGVQGDALHGVGVALLGCGRWADAHRAWQAGFALAPEHAALAAQAAKDAAYAAASAGDSGGGSASVVTEGVGCVWENFDGGVFLTREPVLSGEECAWAVETAEAHAQEHKGWTTSRHYAVPTTDLPVHAVPALRAWFCALLRERLFPLLSAQFAPRARAAHSWHVHDAFVVRYSHAAQRHLPLHADQSTHSLTVALNGAGAFEGGGTYFQHLDSALRTEAGHVLSFKGDLIHGGDPITEGTRYIIAAFLYLDEQDASGCSNKQGPLAGQDKAMQVSVNWKEDAGSAFSFGFGDAS